MVDAIDPLCEIPVNFGCLVYPDTPTPLEKCSPIFSVSEIGDYCRGQFSKLTNGGRDTVMENFCLKNEDAQECKCVNRAYDPDYQKLKLDNPYSDSCWYIPCSNRFQYFVPSSFNVQTKCPQNICQIVYDIAQVHDVDINHIKNEINCDFSNGGVIPDPTALPSWIYVAALGIMAGFIMVYALAKK